MVQLVTCPATASVNSATVQWVQQCRADRPCACFCRSLLSTFVASKPALSHSCRGITSRAFAMQPINSCSLPAIVREWSRKYLLTSISMAPPPAHQLQTLTTGTQFKPRYSLKLKPGFDGFHFQLQSWGPINTLEILNCLICWMPLFLHSKSNILTSLTCAATAFLSSITCTLYCMPNC